MRTSRKCLDLLMRMVFLVSSFCACLASLPDSSTAITQRHVIEYKPGRHHRNESSVHMTQQSRVETMQTWSIVMFYYLNRAHHKVIVPDKVSSMFVELHGAGGGTYGGRGDTVMSEVAVSPGDTFYLFIGEMGDNTRGGYNGGGNPSPVGEEATGGGGATDFRSSLAVSDRLLVAGGGGGIAGSCGGGGDGGYPAGQQSDGCPPGEGGLGGSQTAGGIANSLVAECADSSGSLGQGGDGCTGDGAGGGGGYYGGAGSYMAGGGGGSSYSAFGDPISGMSMDSMHGYATVTYSRSFPPGAVFLEWIEPPAQWSTYTVPAGMNFLYAELHGSWGNCDQNSAAGGLGGMIAANLSVTPGEELRVYLGNTDTNAGGAPSGDHTYGGGGATDIRRSPYGLADRLLVAGGGGGCHIGCLASGGGGGYPTGEPGLGGPLCTSFTSGGLGGDQQSGGQGVGGSDIDTECSASGSSGFGVGGEGCGDSGAGGGGGWYGGGGAYHAGGGGGSSYSSVPDFIYINAENGDWGYAFLYFFYRPAPSPTLSPTARPTSAPTILPSVKPTTVTPTCYPTAVPTLSPTQGPTGAPTLFPTSKPTAGPTAAPTVPPTFSPTRGPSVSSTTAKPSMLPTVSPTVAPTFNPTVLPTRGPTAGPTVGPTAVPTCRPTSGPTVKPTVHPTAPPIFVPTAVPTANPTMSPTRQPTIGPSVGPSANPSISPTRAPTVTPTVQPTAPGVRITSNTYHTNGGYHKFVVPDGVTSLYVQVHGARAGGNEVTFGEYTTSQVGTGHVIFANMEVTPGQIYYLFVGKMGSTTAGGYNGGGAPGAAGSVGGGGASDIRTSLGLESRIVVAAGGGGDGLCGSGGGGWYPAGGAGVAVSTSGLCALTNRAGAGGTGTAGGIADLTDCGVNGGKFGKGGNGCAGVGGGGGGGGYFGGAGGFRSSGGGGSSFITAPATPVDMTQRYNGGGSITIQYSVPYPENAIIYNYNGGYYTYTVPERVTRLWVELHGAWGNCWQIACGGLGGMIRATLPVTPGETLRFYIGGMDSNGPGFNGAGVGSYGYISGGGGTDVRRSPYGLDNRLLVAGGGGGCHHTCGASGGDGGYPSGMPGKTGALCSLKVGGNPGNQTAGGAIGNATHCASSTSGGSFGKGGDGCGEFGVGGGGGWFGGGSGYFSGGGGGSSYSSVAEFTYQNGENSKNGYAVISALYDPSALPTLAPSKEPTTAPTFNPTADPTAIPTLNPTVMPTTSTPTVMPTKNPTLAPTVTPTVDPTAKPTIKPTALPTSQPSSQPSRQPSRQPSGQPTGSPTTQPTSQPSKSPTRQPNSDPTAQPSGQPSGQPSRKPSIQPSGSPSAQPSIQPSAQPTGQPSGGPTSQPSRQPTRQPSRQPSGQPTAQPTSQPVCRPTSQPKVRPTGQPSHNPSSQPSSSPSSRPSAQPSRQPSGQPSAQPTDQPLTMPSGQPSNQPVGQPSRQPSGQPTANPTEQPSSQPSRQPSRQPSAQPTAQPSAVPSGQPSSQPTGQPSRKPSGQPNTGPSGQPSSQPSHQPSMQPSAQPTSSPSTVPSAQPSGSPTTQPSRQPSGQPSAQPTSQPVCRPTSQPTARPTDRPTQQPSSQPSSIPSKQPSSQPSRQPTGQPSVQPSSRPTAVPSVKPTSQPTQQPSRQPSTQPSVIPTRMPSSQPSVRPTSQPSVQPTRQPSSVPSARPSSNPTNQPSSQPSTRPSASPTQQPLSQPSLQPSGQPSAQPTRKPSSRPSAQPSGQPIVPPTSQPSGRPSRQPTSQPSVSPTFQPSSQPTAQPTGQPSGSPSSSPSAQPSRQPTGTPTTQPSAQPSKQPSNQPSGRPSCQPSAQPIGQPSNMPSSQPSVVPTTQPSVHPTTQPTTQPSLQPYNQPSGQPIAQPTGRPSSVPSGRPTSQPSAEPSGQPSSNPSAQPSRQPSSVPSGQPSGFPTSQPSSCPSSQPSVTPSTQPSGKPSVQPSAMPTAQPIIAPSSQPSSRPSSQPSSLPTVLPTAQPSGVPSSQPTLQPTAQPSYGPTSHPTSQPNSAPTMQPSGAPSAQPTTQPSSAPSVQPSGQPSAEPTVQPSAQPSGSPSVQPTGVPSSQPSSLPSTQPSGQPSGVPSTQPSSMPSLQPSTQPTSVPSGQPSAQPSRVPSTQPSAVPSGQPTSEPSSLPSGQPSVQPSSSPSGQPTSAPSGQPSASPSIAPSAQPSVNPTTQPSEDPSGQPSASPSGQPSAQPSSIPNSAPTVVPTALQTNRVIYSKAPTLEPSSKPTLSELSVWSNELQSVLSEVTASDTGAIAHRSTYYDLAVVSASPQQRYGGCSVWSRILSGDVNPSQYAFKPRSIAMRVLADGNSHDHLESFNPRTVTCNDATITSSIVAALTSRVAVSRTFTCDAHVWSVRHCPVVDSGVTTQSPAVSVDCSDPCAVTNQCNIGTSLSTEGLGVAPCVQQECSGLSYSGSHLSTPTSLRVLSVAYADLEQAPTVVTSNIAAGRTSIQVTARLSSRGSLFCAVYRASATPSTPTSVTAVQLQNFVGNSDAANTTTVTISGLDASTTYKLYFMTVSPAGVRMILDQVLTSVKVVNTACCKTVTGALAAPAFVEARSFATALTVTLSARPSSAVTVGLVLYTVNGNTTSACPQSWFPSTFAVSQTSPTVFSTSLPALPMGLYEYRLVLSGASAVEFSPVYENDLQRLAVITSAAEPPTPTLQQPIFASDGSFVTVKFSASTDRGGTPSSFACGALFDFFCAATSKCQWIDASTMRASIQGVVSSSNCAQVGASFSLSAAARIKAKCQALGDTGNGNACPNYANWKTVAAAAQTIAAPVAAVASKVTISAPSVLGSCDDLYLDVSGSSGSGGRPWASSSITVLSTAGVNVTALASRLRSITSLTPPPAIPARLLQRGVNYNFFVTLCNFLGQCQTASKQVLVLDDVLPSVTLPGASLRTIYRKDSLTLASSAFIASCDGGKSSVGLAYKWSVSSNNVEQLGLVSTSRDPSRYILPVNTLTVGVLYTVSLSVSIASSAQSSQVSAQVYVQPGIVVAAIKGASQRTVRVGEVLSLDGSGSYDEDQSDLKGVAAGLKYLWTCAQTAPVFNSSCASILEIFDSTRSTLDLVATTSAAGTECRITLTVTDAQGKRSATSTTAIAMLPAQAPVVSITAPRLPALRVINAGQLLQLTGVLSVPVELGGNATWSVDDSSVDLRSVALFPLTTTIAPDIDASISKVASKMFYLALRPNSLPIGATLTFSLTGRIPLNGKLTTSSLAITVNAPPSPGSFYVTPISGVALQQVFQFVAQQWVDPDLPLQYQFGYLDANNLEVTLRSRLELSFGSSMLTAGAEKDQFAVTCVAQIFDAVNANTSATAAVIVTRNVVLNASVTQAFIQRSLSSAAADADGIRQAVLQSSYLLNAVDCTLAPNCFALHRQQCSSTAHTCGACESDMYVGESGDSNEACIHLHAISDRRRFLTSAELHSTAADLALKSCPADCSGHGKCTHILRDSGAVITDTMTPCYIGAIDCVAVCECEADYYGSDTCDLTTEEFALRQTSRSSVIAGLQTLVSMENSDEQVIGGWVSGLQLASQQAAELTEDSSLAVLGLVDSITAAAMALSTGEDAQIASLSAGTMQGLLKAVSSVTAYTTKAAQRRRLASMRRGLSVATSSDGETAQIVTGVLNNVGSLVAQSMLPGQSAMNFTQGDVRMSVQVLADSLSNAGNITAVVPQTTLEAYLEQPSSSVSVPASSTDGVSLVVSSVRSELFDYLDSDLQSNPVVLYASADLCAEPPCYVDLVIQNSQAVDYAALNAPSVYVHNVSCDKAEHRTYNVTCPDGTAMQMQCNGTAGILHRQCPVTTYSAVCSTLGSATSTMQSDKPSECVTHAYTDTEVICRCDTSYAFAQQRRLQSGNFTAPSGYSASYAAMLSSTANSFVNTISTADNLDASTITKGWRALATLGTLAGAIIFALFWSNYSDSKAKKVTPEDSQEKQSPTPASLEMLKKAKNSKKAAKKRRFRISARSRQVLVNAELAIVEESLPKALSSRTFSDRFLEEVKQHHRWFGIIFYFSDSFPRVLRVISLASNAIIMLFIQSITYNLTNPDDGSCAVFHTETTCLEPKSPFATGESKCAWLLDNVNNPAAGGTCAYIEPDNSVRIILFVAIFCAVVTTPIAMATDWVVRNILSAPTESDASLENETAALNLLITTAPLESLTPAKSSLGGCKTTQIMPAESVQPLVPVARPSLVKFQKKKSSNLASFFSVFASEMQAKEDKIILATSRAELLSLAMKLKRYRSMLRPDEREEFDILWGLDGEGDFRVAAAAASTFISRLRKCFMKPEEVNVKEAVLGDLQRINTTVQNESKSLKASDASKHEIGKKLLFLFQCDLLPGISGKILEQKGGRDFAKVKPVSAVSKIMGYTFLFLMNAGMLFYILLFALTQTGPRQNAWFKSFALWLVVEIFMVSTAIVFFTHILIPSLVMKDLTQIKRRLMDNIRDFNEKVSVAKTNPNGLTEAEDAQKISFNAANYLFVSTRLARQFPDLKESKIIAQFSTPWPRQSYLHVQNVSKGYSKKFSALTRSASILIIFFVGNFLAVPPSVQDIAVQMTSTVALGYGLFIHLQLYEIYPVLVVVPALVIAVLVHFFIQSSKADARNKLAHLFPMKQKKNIASVHPLDDFETVDANVTVVAEALKEESKHNDFSSDDYSISSEEQHAPVSAVWSMSRVAQNRHQTRRESLNAGLNVLNTLQKTQIVMMPAQSEDSTSADSNKDQFASDTSSSGVEEETEEEEEEESEEEEGAVEEEEDEEESSDANSDDGDGDGSENTEENGSSEIDSSDLESDSGNGIESECESASLINAATAKRSGRPHRNCSSVDMKSFSDAPSSLCAQELDGNLTQFSDELHMPLGTPLFSPHTVRRKKSGRQSAPVMRIGEDGFSDSDESSESSSGSDNESNGSDYKNSESDTESEYEYVYVTESEDEKEEREYETQSESDCESEGNSCDEAGSVINQLAAPPETKQGEEVKDFESLSSVASRPYQAFPFKPLCTNNTHALDRTRIAAGTCSTSSSSAPSIQFSDELELEPESREHVVLRSEPEAQPSFNERRASICPNAIAHHAVCAISECVDVADSASSSGSGTGGSVSSSSSSEASDSDIGYNENVNDDSPHSESISTMSTSEAAAALEVYRVVDKPNNKQPATALEASAFVTRIVTSGVRKVSTVVPRTADLARDSDIEGSSDDYKSISDLSS